MELRASDGHRTTALMDSCRMVQIRSAFCHFLKRNEGKYGIQASGGDSVWLNRRRLLDPGWARELSTRLLGWEQAGAGRSPAASWQQLKSRESL